MALVCLNFVKKLTFRVYYCHLTDPLFMCAKIAK